MGRQLKEVYAESGLIRFEYKDLAFLGEESVNAAEAAACADEQDAFWPYHETIYVNQRGENQGAFSNSALKAFAAAIGLDQDAFDSCLDGGRYQAAVRSSTAAAQNLGIRSTPTVVFNGEILEGAITFERLAGLIQAELGN